MWSWAARFGCQYREVFISVGLGSSWEMDFSPGWKGFSEGSDPTRYPSLAACRLQWTLPFATKNVGRPLLTSQGVFRQRIATIYVPVTSNFGIKQRGNRRGLQTLFSQFASFVSRRLCVLCILLTSLWIYLLECVPGGPCPSPWGYDPQGPL